MAGPDPGKRSSAAASARLDQNERQAQLEFICDLLVDSYAKEKRYKVNIERSLLTEHPCKLSNQPQLDTNDLIIVRFSEQDGKTRALLFNEPGPREDILINHGFMQWVESLVTRMAKREQLSDRFLILKIGGSSEVAPSSYGVSAYCKISNPGDWLIDSMAAIRSQIDNLKEEDQPKSLSELIGRDSLSPKGDPKHCQVKAIIKGVNGDKPLHILLDTGSDATMISRGFLPEDFATLKKPPATRRGLGANNSHVTDEICVLHVKILAEDLDADGSEPSLTQQPGATTTKEPSAKKRKVDDQENAKSKTSAGGRKDEAQALRENEQAGPTDHDASNGPASADVEFTAMAEINDSTEVKIIIGNDTLSDLKAVIDFASVELRVGSKKVAINQEAFKGQVWTAKNDG